MTIQELSAETVKGTLKIIMKDGETLIGGIPVESYVDTQIMFLPHEFFEEFYKKFKQDQKVFLEDIQFYIKIIEKENIESFELFENDVKDLKLENNKPIPQWLECKITIIDKPGHVNIEYKIPQHHEFFKLGDLKIKDGYVTLPITFVFLSYAKEDKESVLKVMDRLHENGVITWFDEKDLLPGDDWESKIEESIEKADYVFIFLSSKTIDKIGYKNKEVNYALNQYLMRPSGKRYIIPILLDECTPPKEFKKIHWIKTTELNWFNKILSSIGKKPK